MIFFMIYTFQILNNSYYKVHANNYVPDGPFWFNYYSSCISTLHVLYNLKHKQALVKEF